MKKILSILVGLFLGLSMACAQTVTIYGYALGEGISEDGITCGGGTITIKAESASYNWLGSLSYKNAFTKTGESISGQAQEAAFSGIFSSGNAGVKVTLSGTPYTGFYLAGFTEGKSLTGTLFSAGTITRGYVGQDHDVYYSAIFKRILSVKSQTNILAWENNGSIQSNDANIVVAVYDSKSGDVLNVEFIDDPDDSNDLNPTWFQSVQGSTVTSSIALDTDNTFKFSVRYNGTETNIDNIKNKNVTIKLTAKDNKDEKIIKIKITEPPLLTFKGTGGKGKYAVSLFADEIFDTNSADNYPMVITNNNLLREVELSLKSDLDNNSIFFGWRVTNDELGKDEILSMAETTKKNFAGGDVIEAVFIPNTCGYMIMHDEGAYYEPGGGFIGGIVGDSETEGWVFDMKLSNSIMYYDMQQAVDAAELLYKSTMKNQFVVLENLATIFSKLGITRSIKTPSNNTVATLPNRDGGYTIPTGVTLLIPADNTYMYAMGDLDPKRYSDGLTFSPYRKLIVESGTQIIVNGSISVFAKLNYVHTSTSNVVGSHGILELQAGAHIDVYGGLYVMGYIINPEKTTITEGNLSSVGHITARSGATIYEVLQLQDWRGGTATSGMVTGSTKVFPLNQYYVQNIETPITFENGSYEYLTAAIYAQKMVSVVHPLFVKPKSDTGKVGFFELGEGTSFTKYYDWSNDRLKCIPEGSLNQTNPTAHISNMALNLSLASIDSKNFVLPITNNIDIRVKNLTIKMPYDVCFLPGSTLTIEDNAKGYIDGNASIFVYDKEWSTTNGIGTGGGYFGQYNSSKILLPKRPGGFKEPRRTIDDDATILIDGMVEVGANAAVYTTAEGTEGYSYGAKIISTNNGRVKFGNIGTKTYTQQVTQSGDQTSLVNIPVSSARLKNANGTYVKTTTEDKGKTYMYVEGEWKTQEWTLPTIKVTLPTQVFNGEVGYLIVDGKATDEWTAKISGDGFTFDGQNTTKDVSGYNITLPIQYDAQNKHGVHTATLTLTNKANSSKTYETEITATEDYMPKFSASSPVAIPMTYIGSSNHVTAGSAFQINIIDGNVTALMNDTESEYYQGLSWKPVSDNNQFTFTFGEGRNALSNAQITFTPTTAGDQSATITLTATYKDANGHELTNTEEVKMVVNAKGENLAINTLKLSDDCIAALENMCVNVPIELEFEERTTNANDLILEFEDNGNPAVLTYTGSGTAQYPFVVTANAIPTSTMPTIKITQAKDLDSGVDEGVVTCITNITKCTPIVQWNWSDMYFGYSYENPIKSNSTGNYTLTLKSITKKNGDAVTPANVMSFDANAKTAEVKQNTDEYVATFEFSQEESDTHAAYPTTTFTANIYANPAKLPLCVDNERIFTAINYDATENGVNYNTANNPYTIDIAAGASWTMTFIGVPDILSFTPTTNTRLTVEQSENGISFGTVFFNTIVEGQNYQVELAPATKYVKFTVVDATAFSSLCLTALNRVRLEPKILYMPIAEDPVNNPTARTVKATYVNNSDKPLYMISSDGSNIIVSPDKLEPTVAGEYKEIDITISSKATSEFTASVSVEHKEGGHAQVDIETYRFPQKLPIQLEKGIDPAKRFYFVTTAYKNTEWDAAQYAIKMQNKTTTEADRPFVTFAFDGAPSFISFVPLIATNIADWKIEESEDGLKWGDECSGATLENGVLKQTLTYATHYVRVTYVGTSAEVVQMTKVNILSDQSAIPNPEELELTDANEYVDNLTVGKDLNLTVVNLTNLSVAIDNEHFTLSYGSEIPATTFTLNADNIADVFGEDVVGTIPFKVFWDASQATDFGNITFTTEVDGATKTLATVPLVGTKASISKEDVIYTGVKTDYTLDGKFEGIYGLKDEVEKSTAYREVDLSSTYDKSGAPLFDYLIIYGETTTTDGTTTITTPTTTTGSNAKTPMYIYYKDGNSYQYWSMEENVNSSTKAVPSLPIAKGEQLRIYITGFCPYATTGYTKEDEGVWYFQGVNGAKLDIYLEDCYIYSRHKTLEGRAFSGRYDGQAFSEGYVRGSGGVLVFENQDNDQSGSFDVTIHTRRNNMFKSNYGCFFELMQGMRAYNVSSPIQVHLASDKHKANSKTTLTFDDKWPTDASDYSKFERTNGYLSLQKQVNNAPSIDLGNANTIVNFRGGQVELQNAAVVSPNYKTTFAISFRSGLMAGIPMAYGIGTDDVGGTVNFYDGTTTVIPMEVDIKFRDYYLMDTDANGKELSTTSCLRTPTNTFVYGGSHCMMRACEDVTSKGGAPTRNSKPLGIYKYPKTKPTSGRGGFGEMNAVGLVTPTDIPTSYKAESVTPNTNGTPDTNDDYLNFWFSTEDEPSVTPEVDKKINFWKACMTQISAEYMSYGGTVGGETMILPNEENKYLLYCQIDENISNVISAGTGFGEDRKYTYMAPVKDPTGQLATPYLSIPPSYVGEEYQNYIETVEVDKEDNEIITGENYTISEKVYYVVPTTADTWMTFTAPFNVEKLWIVEAYEEAILAVTPPKVVKDEAGNETTLNERQSVLLEQAKHNADFAAFFGVAMALGRDQTFDEIYNDYIGWAKHVDKKENTRGKIKLEHYNGNNFFTANYYLYQNTGEWTRLNGDKFDTKWEVVGEVAEGEILMHQGKTYSMLFPYCTGCDVQKDSEGNIIVDANGLPQLSAVRDYWDYWSGKFLIFESTQATSNNPHTIKGSKYHEQLFAPATSGNGSAAVLTGNSTFALMTSKSAIDDKVYTYSAEMGRERFKNNTRQVGNTVRYQTVQPTVSFLIADIPAKAGAPARGVMRTGEIIYGKDNTATDVNPGGNIPTVGGGNDLFITSIVEGINIAVAEPQHVRVLSSTGAVLYSGMVQTAVDVALPTTGVYVITGENEVHKILH